MNYEDKIIVGIIATALNVIGHLSVADYPKDMLETRTNDELAESISSKTSEQLEYMGAIIYGSTDEVNEITGKFQLWRVE